MDSLRKRETVSWKTAPGEDLDTGQTWVESMRTTEASTLKNLRKAGEICPWAASGPPASWNPYRNV
ncbi:MAG: hypothetical protein LBG06_02935 [Deltaproteobacteria bacterium]|jgi:hypothetical protein|nr:hypothetical protein [Deltaproteobacteria bacterium]